MTITDRARALVRTRFPAGTRVLTNSGIGIVAGARSPHLRVRDITTGTIALRNPAELHAVSRVSVIPMGRGRFAVVEPGPGLGYLGVVHHHPDGDDNAYWPVAYHPVTVLPNDLKPAATLRAAVAALQLKAIVEILRHPVGESYVLGHNGTFTTMTGPNPTPQQISPGSGIAVITGLRAAGASVVANTAAGITVTFYGSDQPVTVSSLDVMVATPA